MAITAEQREERRNNLGSSDTPTIMNLSPYKRTESDIYWSKVAVQEDEETDSMNIGTWLEKPLIEWAAGELGVDVETEPRKLRKVAAAGDGAGVFAANNDALILGREAGIEAKFVNGELAKAYGEAYSDEVPDHVIVQTQHQMYCSDLQLVYVAMATPSYFGITRSLYTVKRDEELIAKIVDFGMDWWTKHVLAKTPPDGAGIPPMYVLKAMHRDPASLVTLGEDSMALADRLETCKALAKKAKADVEQIKQELIFTLGESEIGKLPDGRRVCFEAKDKRTFDVKGFRVAEPDTASKWTKTKSSRTMYVKKATKGR